jgi:hypothetical protein
MRDLFYTILILWVVFQIYNSFKGAQKRAAQNPSVKKEGDVTVENMKSKPQSKNNDGEYVDFEEVKD